MSLCNYISIHHGTKQLAQRFACLWDAARDLGLGEAKEAQVIWPGRVISWLGKGKKKTHTHKIKIKNKKN